MKNSIGVVNLGGVGELHGPVPIADQRYFVSVLGPTAVNLYLADPVKLLLKGANILYAPPPITLSKQYPPAPLDPTERVITKKHDSKAQYPVRQYKGDNDAPRLDHQTWSDAATPARLQRRASGDCHLAEMEFAPNSAEALLLDALVVESKRRQDEKKPFSPTSDYPISLFTRFRDLMSHFINI